MTLTEDDEEEGEHDAIAESLQQATMQVLPVLQGFHTFVQQLLGSHSFRVSPVCVEHGSPPEKDCKQSPVARPATAQLCGSKHKRTRTPNKMSQVCQRWRTIVRHMKSALTCYTVRLLGSYL